MRRLSISSVRKLCVSRLAECGASEAHSNAIADILTRAEADGCHSHGLFRLPAFLKGCLGPHVDARAEPLVSDIAAGAVKVDARGGSPPHSPP